MIIFFFPNFDIFIVPELFISWVLKFFIFKFLVKAFFKCTVIVWGLNFFVLESEKVIGKFVCRKYDCQWCASLWGWCAWPIIGTWVSFLLCWPLPPRAERNFSNSFSKSKKKKAWLWLFSKDYQRKSIW